MPSGAKETTWLDAKRKTPIAATLTIGHQRNGHGKTNTTPQKKHTRKNTTLGRRAQENGKRKQLKERKPKQKENGKGDNNKRRWNMPQSENTDNYGEWATDAQRSQPEPRLDAGQGDAARNSKRPRKEKDTPCRNTIDARNPR